MSSKDVKELESIREYLWPDQTGLPNKYRNALVAIKARERLLKKQTEDLVKLLKKVSALTDDIENDDFLSEISECGDEIKRLILTLS